MIRRWLQYRLTVLLERRELRSLRRESEMAELRYHIAKAQRMEAEYLEAYRQANQPQNELREP